MEGKFISYEGGKIYYTDRGEGQTLVLIHGYLLSSEVWGEFRDSLAERYRVIALDLPGNGKSSVYEQNHTMCFHAEAVLSILDAEKIEKAIVLGHSLGGYVTLSLVDNHPERLLGYALLHSHPYADTDEIIENRLREIKVVKAGKKESIYPVNIPKMYSDNNLKKFSDEIIRLQKIASGHSEEGIIAVVKGMIQRKSRADIMYQSTIPMLYIIGRSDNYIPYDSIISKVLMPVSGKIVTLEESGHMGFHEETEILIENINHFIRNL